MQRNGVRNPPRHPHLHEMTKDPDVIVIGAGVAGLSAAAALRAQGKSVAVLEATARPGGRARTLMLGADAFDAGASWLHDAERNALTDLARQHADPLIDSDIPRPRTWFIAGRRASAAELAGLDPAAEAFDTACRTAARGEDISLAQAIAPLRRDPWMATVENWEAVQIAAADPQRFSVQDWVANDLAGRNFAVPGGLGALVERRLAPMAGAIAFDTPVTAIDWSGPDVAVTTPSGTLRAASVIVTVSVGVLAAEAIRFTPALPLSHLRAIEGLPMGLLSKVALRAPGLDLPADSSARKRIDHAGQPCMSFHIRPQGSSLLVGFVGGPTAWALASQPPEASAEFARAELVEMFGPAEMEVAHVTSWGTEAWQRGAYTYALVGQAGARAALGMPLAGGRLVFAGEAVCTDGLAGTVGGAWNSGISAAAATCRR